MECNEFPRKAIDKRWGEIYDKAKERIVEEVSEWENVTQEDLDKINIICEIWDNVVGEVLVSKK